MLREATLVHASPDAPPSVGRTRRLMGFQILGTGCFVPDPIITNEHLRENHGFNDAWIWQRMGIRERRHAPPEMVTSDLCHEAAIRCLRDAGCDPMDVDMLVVATFTPDFAFPSTSCLLQNRMGLFCGAFDVQAACAGFMYALVIGAQFIATGNANRCLVVGGDLNSRMLNPADEKTYPLFGDGAGAVLLGPGTKDQGLLAYHLGADGGGGELLTKPAGGTKLPFGPDALQADLHYLRMDGRAVFRWAVNLVTDSTSEVMKSAGLCADDIDLFVPHQANIRIINAVSDVLGFPRDRVVQNIDRYGNTSAGSIPIALDEALRAGRVERGDKLLFSGFGAGLTWGSGVLAW